MGLYLMYGIDNFSIESVLDKFREAEFKINVVYDSLPKTIGCKKNIADVENSCGAWCCEEQNPSVWFCEFLNTLSSFMFKMDPVDFSKLIELCLKKYLLIDRSRGCVFWDSDTKLCKQHESRPINCYFYGVIPKEEFEPRYKRLKVLNNDIKPQCDRISLEDGSKFTSKSLIDKSFNDIKLIETDIGVPDEFLNDDQRGSYRTYTEHILLWVLGEDQMCNLSEIRSSSSILDKKKLIITICENLKISLSK
jgi:hypothetical protein